MPHTAMASQRSWRSPVWNGVPVSTKEFGLVVDVIMRMPTPLSMSGITQMKGFALYLCSFGSSCPREIIC